MGRLIESFIRERKSTGRELELKENTKCKINYDAEQSTVSARELLKGWELERNSENGFRE